MKKYAIVWIIIWGIFNFSCTAKAAAIKPAPSDDVYRDYDSLINDVVEKVIEYAGASKDAEKSMKFLLVIDPTMINAKGYSFKDKTWVAFNRVNKEAYKFALRPNKRKKIMDYLWHSNDEALYKAVETEFDKANFPDRIIKIERLESPYSLTFSILNSKERKPVENLEQTNYLADFLIFGDCKVCDSLTQRLMCYLDLGSIKYNWANIPPHLFKSTGKPEDENGYIQLRLTMGKKDRELLNRYRFRLLTIFELDKDRRNIIAMWLHSPKYQFLNLLSAKPNLSYLYLYICFNPPRNRAFSWKPGSKPGDVAEGKECYDENCMDTFYKEVVQRLKDKEIKEVMIYALPY